MYNDTISQDIEECLANLLRISEARSAFNACPELNGVTFEKDDFTGLFSYVDEEGRRCTVISSAEAMLLYVSDVLYGVSAYNPEVFQKRDSSLFLTIGGKREDINRPLMDGWL